MVSTLARKWQLQSEDRQKLEQTNERLRTSITQLQDAQGQLVQAGKLASIGQLAAGVAHELNNPLAVILGFAQGLERRLDEQPQNQLPVKSIVRETLRCKDLVEELLTFSRSGSRLREPTDLNALVRGAVAHLETRAASQHVGIVQELVEDAPVLQANPVQLQQVLINLGHNALDAMAAGGNLTIRTLRTGPAEVQLEIQDEGTGITDDVRGRLFEPFFTTKTVGQGTGLGLSLAYETVQQHRGIIEVDTEVGRGTTMRVRLPLT
jgi:two-component system, NtrC family, sensor kinase